ncbi:MAG: hypothetical protein M1282_15020 [Chloroflexi bacterium]|nr:hypothetical protein [Chloroflexota bacterium]
MPKTFYTEKDIDELFKQGIRSLKMTDRVALTDLAYERANRLGIQLEQDKADNPPAAPVRPYLSQPSTPRESTPAPSPSTAQLRSVQTISGRDDLQTRIRDAVTARLGNQIDPALLDSIIQRVLKTTGLK